MTYPVLPVATVARLLADISPDCEWLLSEIESEHGWFRFPKILTDVISNLRIENYPLLYEKEGASAILFLRAFLGDDEIKKLDADLNAMTVDERGHFLEELASSFVDAFDSVEIPKTPAEQQKAREAFQALDEDTQRQVIRSGSYFYCFFFSNFYQQLSLMVHGEKLTSLVAQAKAGNDDAFVKAIQIDKRILTVIPYFKARYARAHDEGDRNFLDHLAYRINCPPYRGKIRFKSLYLALSILNEAKLLDSLSHREILDMLTEAGVGGPKNHIEDVKYLTKRIAEFRHFQKRGVVSTP